MNIPYSPGRPADWVTDIGSEPLEPWRAIAIYSATIAIGDTAAMSAAIVLAKRSGVDRPTLYEIVLQSYLFLGFPRMLGAAETLAESWPQDNVSDPGRPDLDIQTWWDRGQENFNRVYGDKAERLRSKVEAFAPEVFDWMVLEGYGKVLSRPQLDMPLRELSIIAFLVVDNRPKQLMSHILGAVRVGTPPARIIQTVEDLRGIVPSVYKDVRQMLVRCGIS